MKTLAGFNPMMESVSGVTNVSIPYNYSQRDTKATAFETVNGESILVYYYPNCKSYSGYGSGVDAFCPYSLICAANFVYDLNGAKGPNTVGKDIGFITVLYPTDSVVVAPMPAVRSAWLSLQRDGGKLCKAQDSESRMPNIEELSAIFYNQSLTGIEPSTVWSSSLTSNTAANGALAALTVSFYTARRIIRLISQISKLGVSSVK